MQEIEVGGEVLEFPDDMSDDEIRQIIEQQIGKPEQGFFSATVESLGNAAKSLKSNPLFAVPAITSSAIAEPTAGLSGILSLPLGSDQAAENVGTVREALTLEPEGTARTITEGIGSLAEGATKGARNVFARLAQLPEPVRERMVEEGVGPVLGEAITERTGSPALGAITAAIPTGIVAAFGGLAGGRATQRLQGISDDLIPELRRLGIDPNDASPSNVVRIQNIFDELTEAQRARVQAFERVGIDEPTRAQITRSADDFQAQQEVAKRSGRVRDVLEEQEARLAERFDEAIGETQGRPVTSGSTVVDEVVGRSTRLDNEISQLYRQVRESAPKAEIIDLSAFANRVRGKLPSDRAADGIFRATMGELRLRGIVNSKGKPTGKRVSVAEAEEIRQSLNALFDPKNKSLANSEIRALKNTIDDAVFKTFGDDIFDRARSAKAQFEAELSVAKISKFDKNTKSLVRDILENKIDPDSLVDRITSSKSYRASDLRQLRDYLNQTDSGIAAFDDLRAQTLRNIKEKSFVGPEDANGVRALSRARLESVLARIGKDRMSILFTPTELAVIDDLLKVSRLREPVRGTALGKGPSAQAILSLNESLGRNSILANLIDAVSVNRQGRVVMAGRVNQPDIQIAQGPGGVIGTVTAGETQ